MTARLSINPDPIRVVDRSVREVWERRKGWRCDHEDGRGRCASRDTRPLMLSRTPIIVGHYCAKHLARHDVLIDRDEK